MKPTTTYFLTFFLLLALSSSAQLNYLPGGFSTSGSTYTDLGLNGDTISVANKDDAFSAPLPIGFTFNFNGAPYDSFVFSTNGFIKLGSDSASRHFLFTTMAQPPASGPFNTFISPAPLAGDSSMLFAFGQDLYPGPLDAEFRYYTDGAPGSRVCTIQWKNVRDKLQATVSTLWDTISFQLKLYESTNVVEYVYGKWVSAPAHNFARFSAVGIVGNSMTAATQNIHLVKGSTVAWNAAVARTGFYVDNAVNYRNPLSTPPGPAPDEGRIYRFTPITMNDAAVNLIYAQGRISLSFSRPDSIRANISNPGVNSLSSLVVNLTITGDHPYSTSTTIPSLAPNSNTTIAFAPYIPLTTGSSVITVSVPADDNPANNEKTYSYAVGSYAMAYTDTLVPHTGSNGTTIPNFWGARYFVNGDAIITTVRSFMVINSDAQGDTVAGVILDTLGNVLARSANRIVQTSDLGTTMVFPMLVPAHASNQSIIAGIAGGTSVNGINYFLGTSQTEAPIRPNSPFYFMTQVAPGGVSNLAVGAQYAAPVTWGTTRLMMECDARPLPQTDSRIIAAAPVNGSKVPVNTPIPLTAVVKNIGLGALPSGIPVRYQVGNGPVVGPLSTATFLNPGDTTSVVFSGVNAITFTTPGNYTVKVYSSVAGDSIPGNDTLFINYTAQAPAVLPYRIDNNVLGSWTVENPTPALWKNGTGTQPNGSSSSAILWADNPSVQQGVSGRILSPFFSFTGIGKPTLHFHVAHATDMFLTAEDTLEVLISTDGGYSFQQVWMKSSTATLQQLATDSPTMFAYAPVNKEGWRHEMVDLTAYAGQGLVLIAFKVRSGRGNGIYVTNITVTNPVSSTVQPVFSPSSFSHANVFINLMGPVAPFGEISISKYNGTPPSTASPVFAANTTAVTNNNSVFTPDRVCLTEWYTVTYTGTGPSNPPQNTAYTISIDAASIPGVANPDSVYIMQRSAYNAPWVPVNTVYGHPSFISGTINGFSDFALGSTSTSNPLPVSWLRVNGRNISQTQNMLTWSTASETNNSHFMIEKALSRDRFTEIAKVNGSGNSTSERKYTYTDESREGFANEVYYRVKQVDFDGKQTYSPVVTIVTGNRTEVAVSNPFESAPKLDVIHTEDASMQVIITDVSGKTVGVSAASIGRGRTSVSLREFETLQSGIYFIRLKIADGEWMVKKVVKQ